MEAGGGKFDFGVNRCLTLLPLPHGMENGGISKTLMKMLDSKKCCIPWISDLIHGLLRPVPHKYDIVM